MAKVTETMKNQTIGVEIEMNHITRQYAAMIAAGFFGTNHFENTAYIHGYKTWSAWDAQGREWKFQRDVSISGEDDLKCEMVTPILKYEDIETLQELVRILRKAGAVSNAKNGCGVHIHIGADGHTAKSLRNLVNIMASHEELIGQAIHIDHARTEQYCKVTNQNFLKELNAKKPETMEQLKDIWYNTQGCGYGTQEHYNPSRYHMLNLHATFTKGTVEFRLFQFDNPHGQSKGGLHAGKLKAYIQLALAINQAAKEAKTASPKKLVTDNPKYAMRCWLLRMGFIGEEFKTAREHLTCKLDGDAAFRHGRQQGETGTEEQGAA